MASLLTFTQYTFGSDPNAEFRTGGLLHGYDGDAFDPEDYPQIEEALQEQLGVTLSDEEVAGRLPNGAIAVIGLSVEGHPFWITDGAA